MLKLFRYFRKKDWILIFASILLIVGQVWLDLTLPDFMSDITVLIETEGSAMADILAAGGKMLLCALGSAALSIIVGYFAAATGASFSYLIREKIFTKVSAFGIGEMHRFSTPSLITRTTNDITQVQMVISMGLQVIIKAPILAVWAVCKIIGKSWELSLTTAVAVIFIAIVLTLLILFVIPKFKILQKLVDNMNRVTRENLTGLRVVRAFNAEEYQTQKFEEANRELTATQLFAQKAMSVMQPTMMLVMNGLSLAIYWIGAHLIQNAGITEKLPMFGDVVVFSSYAMFVIMSFMMLIMIFMILPRAEVSANRINEVIESEIAVREGTETQGTSVGEIEFRNVSFHYPDSDKNVLSNINFTAKKGETVAFIGATGSGKTTLVNLAARLYDATEGCVLLDGIDIREYTFQSLYDRLGYVSQKAVIFSDTIRNNILFGESAAPVSDENISAALEIAQASDFVAAKENGLDAELSQGGANVSGGQKQRLSIARAIARRPEILIFDDSFSALDYKTDNELRSRIASDLKGTTCLIVAQRIGTIKHADKIIVLDDGEAVGIGTHEELLKNCSVYKEIALSQLSAEELNA